MAQPSYTTNLTLLDGCNTDTGYVEPTAAGWTDLNAETFSETDLFIHGANCISATVKTGLGATMFNNTSGITLNTDDAVLMWMYYGAPNTLDTEANGGIRQIIGASQANFDYVIHGGNDTYIYGGWQNIAMGSPATITTTSVGTGTGTTYQYHGWAYKATAVPSKGNPYLVDVMRYGRADVVMTGGDATSGYCVFNELANANDANDISFSADTTNADATLTNISPNTNALYPGAPISGTGIPASTTIKSITNSTTAEMTANATATNTGTSITSQPYNRWGLFQKQSGSTYLWKGLITLGTAGTAVDFRDSNVSIIIDNTKHVSSAFNAIEVNNASSRVDWTNISISATGTVSRGNFNAVANADINFETVTFTDMGTVDFQALSTVNNSTFRRCNLVTTGGATMDGCTFDSSNDSTKAVIVSSPANAAKITNSTFISAGTGHGLEIGGTAANMTLTGVDFTGYDTANPGTAANKAIYVNIASGTMDLNISGGTGVTANHHIRTAGATVTVKADVTVTFTGMKDNTEVRIYAAGTSTELQGIENATAGTTDNRSFAAAIAASTSVDYTLVNNNYEIIRVESFTWPTADQNIAIAQRVDRNYSNP